LVGHGDDRHRHVDAVDVADEGAEKAQPDEDETPRKVLTRRQARRGGSSGVSGRLWMSRRRSHTVPPLRRSPGGPPPKPESEAHATGTPLREAGGRRPRTAGGNFFPYRPLNKRMGCCMSGRRFRPPPARGRLGSMITGFLVWGGVFAQSVLAANIPAD